MSAPTEIEVNRATRTVTLVWPSGERQLLAAERLRRMCPCAECRHRRLLSQSVESPAHIELEQLQPMGYGVQIGFSDGHARGIYPWEYLSQEEMWLDDSSSASSARSDDDAKSDSSDDFLVKADSLLIGAPDFWSGGARRTERLQALQERGALSSIPADAHALAAGADRLRMQAETLDPVPSAKDAEEASQDVSIHGRLRNTLFQCEDAGRAWQTAADQYDAACDPPGARELRGELGVHRDSALHEMHDARATKPRMCFRRGETSA